jgi:hypothetical protein
VVATRFAFAAAVGAFFLDVFVRRGYGSVFSLKKLPLIFDKMSHC